MRDEQNKFEAYFTETPGGKLALRLLPLILLIVFGLCYTHFGDIFCVAGTRTKSLKSIYRYKNAFKNRNKPDDLFISLVENMEKANLYPIKMVISSSILPMVWAKFTAQKNSKLQAQRSRW